MTNIIIMECNTLSCIVSPFHTGQKPIQALVASAFEDKVSRERQRFVFTSSESFTSPGHSLQENFPPFKMRQGQDSAGRELQVIFAAALVQLKHVRSNFKWVNRQIKVLTVRIQFDHSAVTLNTTKGFWTLQWIPVCTQWAGQLALSANSFLHLKNVYSGCWQHLIN